MSGFDYRVDERGDLQPGAVLRFAYSGAGIVTLVDSKGTGYKVAVGTHNLSGVEGECLILTDPVLETDPAFADFLRVGEKPPEASHEAESEAPSPPASPQPIPYDAMSKDQLRALAKHRGLALKGNPSKATIIGHLLAVDHDAPGISPEA